MFYTTSVVGLPALLADPGALTANLRGHIAHLCPAAARLLEQFGFDDQIPRLEAS